jgi:hypothetical protein
MRQRFNIKLKRRSKMVGMTNLSIGEGASAKNSV